jgi:hypothetical protein
MKNRQNHNMVIVFVVFATILISAIASFADTKTYIYDDVNRIITEQYGTPTATPTFVITATAGPNGSISPGTTAVNQGGTQTFTITPSAGYQIQNVLVDGISVGAVTTYTFSNVTTNCSITASFRSPQLTATNAGTGTGTVTSLPAGISCGSTCTALYNPGTVLTLTAAASPGSSFAGWSGGGCSGTGITCTITLNMDTTVQATFNMIPPTASFTASATSGTVPMPVTFTDNSKNNPSQWSWNFGDNATDSTSTLQNPVHIYRTAGTYTVSLTSYNAGGASVPPMTATIYVQTCSYQPVSINRTTPPTILYYSTLQDAYNAAINGDVIQSVGIEFTGTQINPVNSGILEINQNKTVTMTGGYNCGFTSNSGNLTLLNGILQTYSTGWPITIGNFDLVPQ